MADVETTQPVVNDGGDSIIDDGEEAESKVPCLRASRVMLRSHPIFFSRRSC